MAYAYAQQNGLHFLWDDPDQDRWSQITRIMVDQVNR